MALEFKVPEEAYAGLSDMLDIGAEKLTRLHEESAKKELTLDVGSLAKSLAKKIECKAEQLEQAISTVLIPLNMLRAGFDRKPDRFLKEFDDQIKEQNTKWYETNETRWKDVMPAVAPLLAPGGYFSHLRKAFQLLANRPLTIRGFKILTELRPVYNDEATDAKAMLLTSTLVIHYDEHGAAKAIHMTLDESGLETLQDEIDRAGKKVQVLEKQASKLGVPVLIAGAE